MYLDLALNLWIHQFLHYCQSAIYNRRMKRTLDGFILAIPVLFIKQFPYAWISNLQREHAFKDGNFYVNQPPFSWMSTAGRILILMAGAGLLAWLLRGTIRLKLLASLSDPLWICAALPRYAILWSANNLCHHRSGNRDSFRPRSHRLSLISHGQGDWPH